MNAKHLIAALTVFAASASAFAADAPAAGGAQPQQAQQQPQQPAPLVLASAAGDNAYANVNFPSALARKNGPRSRAEVKAEAVEAVRTHQNTQSQQFDFYK